MNFIKFLFTKSFWINIVLLFIAFFVVIFITFRWLDSYTNHGEYITLNDLTGLGIEQTIEILEEKKLNYVVLDTNTYRKDLPHHSVTSQEPLPLDKVKEGRTVYLHISTNVAPLKVIPDLKGKSSQDAAIRTLKSLGFKVGDVFFRPSDSEGNVLGLMIDSVEVEKGQMAPIGTEIQLVVGGGLKGRKIASPCLIGRTLIEAEFLLSSSELNIGSVNYGSKALSDTSSAVIYKQRPRADEAIRIGEPIDIFLIQELPYDINKCETDSVVENN